MSLCSSDDCPAREATAPDMMSRRGVAAPVMETTKPDRREIRLSLGQPLRLAADPRPKRRQSPSYGTVHDGVANADHDAAEDGWVHVQMRHDGLAHGAT